MKKKRNLIIGILAIIIFIIIISLIILSPINNSEQNTSTNLTITPLNSSFQNMSCNGMYNEIENDLNNSNFCVKDNDCDIIMLGSVYIQFGCYHFINKNVDKNLIYQKMDIYGKNCSSIIDKCASAPNSKCVSGKCVVSSS